MRMLKMHDFLFISQTYIFVLIYNLINYFFLKDSQDDTGYNTSPNHTQSLRIPLKDRVRSNYFLRTFYIKT